MGSSLGTLILLIGRTPFISVEGIKGPAFFPGRIDQVVQHVDTYKVGHLSVHLLAVEELEGQVTFLIRLVVVGGLHLHVVEVDFALTDACG